MFLKYHLTQGLAHLRRQEGTFLLNIIPSRKKVPLEPFWVRPSRRLVRVEEVTPPNSESPIVLTMSDEPEIPVPPEPTTHDILKALLAQKESVEPSHQ